MQPYFPKDVVVARNFRELLSCWFLTDFECPAPYSLVRKVLADQEVPGKNIGSNKCTGTSVCRKPEVQILVPVHELSPDFC